MKDIKLILLSLIIINLYACAIVPEQETEDSELEAAGFDENTTRTLILDGMKFKESKPGEFISWECGDYSNGSRTLVEVGQLSLPEGYDIRQLSLLDDFGDELSLLDDYDNTDGYKQLDESGKKVVDGKLKELHKELIEKLNNILGFVLYDDTNTGDIALYERRGIRHRWDWSSESSNYAFTIKSDGTGLFYDFSTANDDGMKSQADDIFKCRRR